MRIILRDTEGRILLLEDSDPGVPGTRWWMTPGGGVDPGESDVAAAVREAAEETGVALSPSDLAGPVATRLVLHGFSDHITEQTEVFFVATVGAFEVDVTGQTDEERITVLRHRWWDPADLAVTDDVVWPSRLLQMYECRDDPAAWPVDFGTEEESTVPITVTGPR